MKPAFIVAAGRVTGDMRLPPAREQAEARARMMMSRSALLASLALHTAVDQAGWSPEIRAAAACFFGVGPSTGDLAALERLLAASASPEGFAIDRLGQRGLRAVSPLFTFQLMHNFTLCHGSILEGIGGPNGAFFSRGAATGHALAEALWALHEGDATHALAGGADAADYPVTAAELRRAGVPGRPAEGAAVLALATAPEGARARVDAVRAWSVDPPALDR
ncbi:MAG: hypothetical protein KC620_03625, partial [Myxococcales bacterium]|nr:hypothetical protein [Myxococcales bacterium]